MDITAEVSSDIRKPNNGGGGGVMLHRLSVPPLDEETIKGTSSNNSSSNGQGGSSSASGGFSLVPNEATPTPTSYMSNAGNGMIPGDGGGGFIVNGVHAGGGTASQAESPLAMAVLQHQAAAAAAAQLEQDYLRTRALLQQCQRSVLLTVLTSLMDEYPGQLVTPIRMRLEQVLLSRQSVLTNPVSTPNSTTGARGGAGSARKGNLSNNGGFVPNCGAAPWTPSSHNSLSAGGSSTTPYNTTSPGHRKGRGHKGREEDQEICSVHGSMRPMKHLQMNPGTGLYECIHGFHCLVDGPAEAAKLRAPEISIHPVPMNTASISNNVSSASNTCNNPIPTNPLDRRGSNSNYTLVSNMYADPSTLVFHGNGPDINIIGGPTCGGANGITMSPEDDLKMDMHQLESLLQSVRNMQMDD